MIVFLFPETECLLVLLVDNRMQKHPVATVAKVSLNFVPCLPTIMTVGRGAL